MVASWSELFVDMPLSDFLFSDDVDEEDEELSPVGVVGLASMFMAMSDEGGETKVSVLFRTKSVF